MILDLVCDGDEWMISVLWICCITAVFSLNTVPYVVNATCKMQLRKGGVDDRANNLRQDRLWFDDDDEDEVDDGDDLAISTT